MLQKEDLTIREAEVIRILKVLGERRENFAVIGGYAINALTSHRFSVDCDIVTDSKGVKEIGKILDKEGYTVLSRVKKKSIYGVKMRKYVKLVGSRKVSVEVFPKEVSCRQTDGIWDFELVVTNSSKLLVVGLTASTEALVPKKELLIAMKIHAGRDTDLRDVTMLSERVDWGMVKEFMSCGDTVKVKRQLESAIATISKSEFASALRAEFGIRYDVSPIIKRTVDGLKKVKRIF
ncbi:MAG: nucleotidyl transferase AbiEii/AbiGii toxin family protein [Candidatus Nitrosotenuis sp.]